VKDTLAASGCIKIRNLKRVTDFFMLLSQARDAIDTSTPAALSALSDDFPPELNNALASWS